MGRTPVLFEPLSLGDITLANRVAVSPMCQYSAEHGAANDWHLQHLGSLSLSGAGLVIGEQTAVEPEGRISHGCLGLYSDANEAALARVVGFCRRAGSAALGIQLAHAGRKSSAKLPWEGGGPLSPGAAAWTTVAPSGIPFDNRWPAPQALDEAGLARIRDAHAAAARRAERLGFDLVELLGAHGFLPRTGMHGLDTLQQGRVGRGAGGRWPLQPGIVTRLGHAEHACHRGNREAGLVRAHEPEEPDGSVPVSRANQAAAFERISRSSRSCLFSRRSRVNSSRSNAVRPGTASSRRPSFRSAWATHARMEWPLGSNSRARSSGLRPARTRSTICRRNSGEYGGRVLGIGSTSGERLTVSTKPGQSQSTRAKHATAWRGLSSSIASARSATAPTRTSNTALRA